MKSSIRGWIGLLLIVVATPAVMADFPTKPDPEMTNGDFCTSENRDFREYRYKERVAICRREVSWRLKSYIYDAYNIPENCRHEYTIDHFVPLSMGGSNESVNLWPEHKAVKATRQSLEQDTYVALNRGEIGANDAVETVVHAKMNPPPVKPSRCHRVIKFIGTIPTIPGLEQ